MSNGFEILSDMATPSPENLNCSDSSKEICISSLIQDFSLCRRIDIDEGKKEPTMHEASHLLQRETGGSSFSKQKLYSDSDSFFRNKWGPTGVILCLLITFFVYFMYSYWHVGVYKFYVVLDCGSTGTRAYVYKASFDHLSGDRLPVILKTYTDSVSKISSGRAYYRMETEPGIHTLVKNTSGLKSALTPLLRWAEKQIPEDARKSAPVFLYATAGVRRLGNADSKWILDKAWSILKRSPFYCKREWVKIISGMEEAYYGWIALNYQMGVLGVKPKKGTCGALDMGGSSLQVTFESSDRIPHWEGNLNLMVGSVNHRLVAFSLVGYGLNDAFDRSVALVMKNVSGSQLADPTLEIKHPCLHSGYNEKYSCAHCALNQEHSLNPVKVGRNTSKLAVNASIPLKLTGAPDWDECRALARTTVNLSAWSDEVPATDCNFQPCALSPNDPHPHGQFYALSGFFVVYRFYNLSSDASLDDVLIKGREFCKKTWDDARKSVPVQPFIEQYCFRAPYVSLLLREGLQIEDDKLVLGSGNITWTVGVALLESVTAFATRLRFFHGYEILQVRVHPLFLIGALFVSLFVLVAALFHARNCIRRSFWCWLGPYFGLHSASATVVYNTPFPLRFRRNSISAGDGKAKMPLSPTLGANQQRSSGSGDVQLESPSLSNGVSPSHSSGSLRQMMESNNSSFFWTPRRSQMRLQSRRSQSREDLISSLSESHLVKT